MESRICTLGKRCLKNGSEEKAWRTSAFNQGFDTDLWGLVLERLRNNASLPITTPFAHHDVGPRCRCEK